MGYFDTLPGSLSLIKVAPWLHFFLLADPMPDRVKRGQIKKIKGQGQKCLQKCCVFFFVDLMTSKAHLEI